jgi:thiamine biosynthesis lipoprotein
VAEPGLHRDPAARHALAIPRRLGPALAAAFLVAACEPAPDTAELLELGGETMGTTYSVKVADLPPSLEPAELQRQIEALLEQVNAVMSTYRRDSELSCFNRARTREWFPVSGELVGVIDQAMAISEITGGAFDVTVGPLVNLFGFGPDLDIERSPTEAELDEVMQYVGYQHLHTRQMPPEIRKDDPRVTVDLSAIAKGYGVDRIAEHLEVAGIESYLVEIGGELRGRGRHPRGTPWRIGVETPVVGERSVFEVLNLRDIGVATSGDYRNYREVDGRLLSHIIDPVTGRPVEHQAVSVTVLDASTMRADALATALLVLGPDLGYRLAQARDIAALFVVKEQAGFDEHRTTRFNEHTLIEEPRDG